MKSYPEVSILISTYNRCEILKHCLDLIKVQGYPKNLLELIILDNSSNDSTTEEIPKYLQDLGEEDFRKTYSFHKRVLR